MLGKIKNIFKPEKIVLNNGKEIQPKTSVTPFVIIGLIVGIPVIVEFAKTGYITKVPSAILATGIMTIALIIGQCGVILDTVVKQNRENYELQLSRFTDIENLKK